MPKILLTGSSGFIGSNLQKYLKNLICVDKESYNGDLEHSNIYIQDDIRTTIAITEYKPDIVIHLASLAGVRPSIKDPIAYVQNNIEGFVHIMNECVKNNVKTVIYASSSSVYGLSENIPFKEDDPLGLANSPYAVSKQCMETYAKMYNQLYRINTIGLRFFTVYGENGRKDMAPYIFLNKIHNNEPITVFGDGTSMRDYTYVGDICEGIKACIDKTGNKIYNLGNNKPSSLRNFISVCEKIVGKKAIIDYKNTQKGDVPYTCADITLAQKELGYDPKTGLEEGLMKMYSYILQDKNDS